MSLDHPPLPPDDAPFDDPDNPEWTEEDFARAKGPESMSEEELAFFPNTLAYVRRMQAQRAKRQAVMRIDADIVAHFKATGADWRAGVKAALRKAMAEG